MRRRGIAALKVDAPPISLDEMKAFLKPRLGKHEMISELEIREVLPKTPVGKQSKKELADDEFRKRQAAASLITRRGLTHVTDRRPPLQRQGACHHRDRRREWP